MRISLFFPAYNEEENIAAAVAQARAVLSAAAEEYEIIVVNDGSRDGTGGIVDRLSKEDPHVRAVHHDPNRGYGAALISGIRAARYEWIFFTDADLQFRLEEIHLLIEHSKLYPVVIGYRSPRRDPFIRLVNAKGWNILNRVMFGLKVRDIDCAFKLFKSELVKDLPMKSAGAAVSAELLIRLQRNDVLIKEVPVTHLPREKGVPTGAKPAVILRAFKELFGLYMSDLGQKDTAYMQAAKFACVGVLNTLMDIGAYFVLTRFTPFFDANLLAAKFTAFFAGTVTSFFLNRRFTFSIRSRPTFYDVVKFYSSVVLTVTVNLAAFYFFNSLLGIYDLFAVGLSTVATFCIGFAVSKLWVFSEKSWLKRPAPSDIADAAKTAKT